MLSPLLQCATRSTAPSCPRIICLARSLWALTEDPAHKPRTKRPLPNPDYRFYTRREERDQRAPSLLLFVRSRHLVAAIETLAPHAEAGATAPRDAPRRAVQAESIAAATRTSSALSAALRPSGSTVVSSSPTRMP